MPDNVNQLICINNFREYAPLWRQLGVAAVATGDVDESAVGRLASFALVDVEDLRTTLFGFLHANGVTRRPSRSYCMSYEA
jgi:hypothetical protein